MAVPDPSSPPGLGLALAPARPRRLLPVAAGPRMRVLAVLPTSNPPRPWVGRAAFELMARLAERVAVEVAVDDRHPEGLARARAFAREHGIPLHLGRAIDAHRPDLADLLRRDDWDLVEAFDSADPATNAVVLRELGDRALAYTPHYQAPRAARRTHEAEALADDIHHRMARRADAVLCGSPAERSLVQAQTHGRNNCHHLPDGLTTAEARPGPTAREPRLLFVGDPADPRERFDRVLAILPRLLATRPDLKLVAIGDGADRALDAIPAGLRLACEPRGPASESELRRAYAESRGVLLLSDEGAAGAAVLEALIAGTPAFLADLDATRSLFDAYRGAHFCPGDDPEGTFEVIDRTLAKGPDAILETLADRDRLRAAFDWDALAIRKWQLLAAAWFARHHVDRPFQGPHVARSAINGRSITS